MIGFALGAQMTKYASAGRYACHSLCVAHMSMPSISTCPEQSQYGAYARHSIITILAQQDYSHHMVNILSTTLMR